MLEGLAIFTPKNSKFRKLYFHLLLTLNCISLTKIFFFIFRKKSQSRRISFFSHRKIRNSENYIFIYYSVWIAFPPLKYFFSFFAKNPRLGGLAFFHTEKFEIQKTIFSFITQSESHSLTKIFFFIFRLKSQSRRISIFSHRKIRNSENYIFIYYSVWIAFPRLKYFFSIFTKNPRQNGGQGGLGFFWSKKLKS